MIKQTKLSSPSDWLLPLCIAAATLTAWFLNTLIFGATPESAMLAWLALIAIYLIGLVWLHLRGVSLRDAAIPLIIVAGFLMQLLPVFRLPYAFSNHDLGEFGALTDSTINGGHLGFINYLVKFGRLPTDVNPMIPEFRDFYHPPVYHIIQAVFFRLNLLLGIPPEAALENLQILTLLAGSLCQWMICRIMQQLGISHKGTCIGLLFTAFQPAFLIFSATPNNDIFSIFFILLTILYALRWAETQTLRNIIGAGIALGLGMGTKLSVGIIALPLGLIFALRFFQNLADWKRYIRQFSVFLLISVPLGTAWQIFHAIAYQAPLNYVPTPAETISLSHLPRAMRFGFPDPEALRSLFYSGIRKLDYNVWFQTLKTALFDELVLFPTGSPMWYTSYWLTALFALLMLVSAVLFVRLLLIRKTTLKPVDKLFLLVYGMALLGSYLLFCSQYAYVCTFNFRYIMPILLLCAVALGDYCSKKKSLLSKLLIGLTALFAALSCFVYIVYLWGA